LIGAIAARLEAVFKIKFHPPCSTRGHDFPAEFRQESAIKFFADAKAVECLGAEWQKRFADMKARKFLALENDHAPTRAREQRRGGTAGGSSTNNADIVHIDLNLVFMVAKIAAKQRGRSSPVLDAKLDGEAAFGLTSPAERPIHLATLRDPN